MIVAILVLSIVGLCILGMGMIFLLAKQGALENYIVRHEKKLDAALDRSFSNEEKSAENLSYIRSQFDEFDHDCSSLLAKVDKLSSQTTAALKGVDKSTLEILKNLIVAIDTQDAMKLSQVIRAAKTMIEHNDSVSEAIENSRYRHVSSR